MTVIVACSWGGKVAIAADSMSSNRHFGRPCIQRKLERYPWGVAGFSGTWRMLPVIHDALRTVKRLKTRRDAWRLVDAVEVALKAAGWKREGEKALPSNEDVAIVLASPHGLWEFQADLAIVPYRDIAVTGCGYLIASGAALAAKRLGQDAPTAARIAALAACDLDPNVCRPVELRIVE